MTTESIRDADDQIDLLERDLIEHCVCALNGKRIAAMVHGVFSLDDLETKIASDLDGRVGVGVAFQGSKNTSVDKTSNPTADPAAPFMNEMLFLILLAVPSDTIATQRHYGTQLLTVLRKGISGQTVRLGPPPKVERGFTADQRPWLFVQEKAEVDESTKTMLYYTQVWRILMPVTGTSKE